MGMTGGEAYKQGLLTEDAFNDAVAAYLADPSRPAVLEIGEGRIAAAAVLAHPYAVEVLAREGVTGPQQRHAVKTAVLLAPAE